MYSQKSICAASVPISTFRCLWAIYTFPGSVHIFSYSRLGRPIVEIYTSPTDKWMWKLGPRPRNFLFWEYLFRFFSIVSLQCALRRLKIRCAALLQHKSPRFHHPVKHDPHQSWDYVLQKDSSENTVCSVPHSLKGTLSFRLYENYSLLPSGRYKRQYEYRKLVNALEYLDR